MNANPVYFLIRHYANHFTCYARGISVLDIHELWAYKIVRFYPLPSLDLTDRIVIVQRAWRQRRAYRKWCSHPFRLFIRSQRGSFPPYRVKNSN